MKFILPELKAFQIAAKSRLSAGQLEYGDRSFTEHPVKLMNEIQEELLDVANWAFILHTRIADLQDALGKAIPEL